MSFSKLFYLVPFMVLSFMFSNCPDGTDVCLSLDASSLNYDSSADIAGFQFGHDGCASGASGGDAGAAGFMISASGTVVLGFSLTGAVIPAGEGTLVDLGSTDCTESSLSDFIFSDAAGGALAVAWSEVASGCMDETACNYDVDAVEDDGSCEYEVDCAGECAGDAVEDCAGECGGDAVVDCAGECDGSAVEDCAGECGGSAVVDECGDCGGDGIADGACDCAGSVEDCAGECGGGAELDDCDVCEGGNADMDCNGECFGGAMFDDCGVCDGDSSTCEYGCEEGVEVCLTLDGGNLNYTSSEDIAGFQFSHNGCVTAASGGDATDAGFMISSSGTAVLGFSLTGAVVPTGSGTLIVLEGDVTIDCLFDFIFSDSAGDALVVGFPVVLVDGCMDDMACNYDPDANSDDGSCEYAEENYDCDGNCVVDTDCAGECGGSAMEDECGICEGDGSLCTASLSLSIDDATGNMLVNMTNAMDVAGFQFVLTNVDINSVSGGSAEANGFMVSAGNGTVVGFSLTGSTIPPGDGPLVEIDFTALWNETCIEDVVLSDPIGGGINWIVGECIALDFTVVDGCTDDMACNYDSDANSDDGSCWYAEENFDCDGNCVVNTDCFGECGGSAMLDECGECGGDNSTCTGCMDPSALNYDSEALVDCGDCCQYPADATIGVSNVVAGGIDVWMENITEVAGFQFNVSSSCDSVSIISGSGGTSGDAGFMVSTSGTTVLGFSLTGATIPVGSGLLVSLETSFVCESGSFGLENVILSDITGSPLTFNIMEDFNYDAACSDMNACNYGEPGDCEYPDECYDCDGNSTCYYTVDINATGESHLLIFMDSISTLDTGDQIGVFDLNGVVESCIPEAGCNTDSTSYGEVLVGSSIWDGVSNEEGTALEISAIMSLDLSDFNGPILNGAVDGNEIVIRVYDVSEGVEYETTELTFDMGGEFGDLMTVVTEIDFEEAPGCDDMGACNYGEAGDCEYPDDCYDCDGNYTCPNIGDACDIDGDGMIDDGFIFDCSLNCVSDAWLGDAWCDNAVPNFDCMEFNCDEGACGDDCMEDLSNDLLSPTNFVLSQNYPNPFNPETTISFSVPNVSEISLTIYDINGRIVDVLAQGVYTPGVHSFIWDGMTLTGEIVPSGVYLYKLITPNQTFSKHLTIIR